MLFDSIGPTRACGRHINPVNAGAAAIPAERAGIGAKRVAVVELFLRSRPPIFRVIVIATAEIH